ncbi:MULTISPECIES: hypothetical protein [Vibrio]|uniref:hypothetical protein n=1 Tax=Vibrio TaxID=662 RepID=UPI0020951FFF|nr:hypothetical protein [Vibrio paracholerae]EGR4170142.1 hypothetical protein [Vibrio cholerae]ELJ8546010.1 hypothetical protein [Vibrio cholerae]ELJ8750052.1 hypothetical protein [Vibrio cholerae]MCO7066792.1 hypothetical protein [Vibrio paracholerae]HDB1444095.1 hypothetical protein [Vibrio cholerae]
MAETNKNYRKLRVAIDELKASNAKINPSAVEKKAGTGNASLSYYEDLYNEVLILKNGGKESSKPEVKKLKEQKNKALKAKRDAEGELAEQKSKVKAEKQTLIDDIANLTWALFKEQRAKAQLEILNQHGGKKL